MNKKKYILGNDGGGTNTIGCIFTSDGFTLNSFQTTGTNLNLYKNESISRIINLITKLCHSAKIDILEISAFGFGLAGISDINQREMFLKELDKFKITSNSLILSDAEAAFHLLCPTGVGLMVSIGTGIICLGRNENGKTYVVSGEGYKKDFGSSYWIGKTIIEKIIINEGILEIDSDLNEIYKLVLNNFKINNLNEVSKLFKNMPKTVSDIASLAKPIIELAKKENDVALSVIQEATRNVAEYILLLVSKLNYNSNDIVISGNGSLLKNPFYRKLINQSLEFDFRKIHWVFSDISPAYGAGMLAAAYKNINIPINKIVERIKN